MTILKYKTFEVDSNDVVALGHDYLLQYGFAKSLQDCVAGTRKAMILAFLVERGMTDEEAKKAFSSYTPSAEEEKEIEAALQDDMQERFNDILKGEVGTRSTGPRLRGIDKVKHEIAVDELKTAFGVKNMAWPSGKGAAENISILVGKFLAKNDARVTEEAERRMKAQAAAADFTLSDLGL